MSRSSKCFQQEIVVKQATFNWARMKKIQRIHRVLYALGLGPLIGRFILLLTTTGRKSGLRRITPLQFERIGEDYYVGAARGLKADWVRNLRSEPRVDVRVGGLHFEARAEIVNDPGRFADFLEVRLERHPRIIGLIMEKAHGLPKRPSRAQLEALGETEVFVILHPTHFSEN